MLGFRSFFFCFYSGFFGRIVGSLGLLFLLLGLLGDIFCSSCSISPFHKFVYLFLVVINLWFNGLRLGFTLIRCWRGCIRFRCWWGGIRLRRWWGGILLRCWWVRICLSRGWSWIRLRRWWGRIRLRCGWGWIRLRCRLLLCIIVLTTESNRLTKTLRSWIAIRVLIWIIILIGRYAQSVTAPRSQGGRCQRHLKESKFH